MNIFEKWFGTFSEKEIKRIQPLVDRIVGMEEEYGKLKDEELIRKTEEFKKRLETETMEELLPEAFATVREAAWRVLGLKPYRVQLIGGILLHQGRIAEIKTGEGKTLIATMPAYLNALTGKSVMIVTVNDYLAKRDSEQMGKVYKFLGLSVGLIDHNKSLAQRKQEYKADIVYATNNEVGFDYLRDNMVVNVAQKMQRGFHYAIIDEVDSILIDEARTPLIISGEGDDVSDGYLKADNFVRSLKGTYFIQDSDKSIMERRIEDMNSANDPYRGYDYVIDEKQKTVSLTDGGIRKAEKYYNIKNLGDIENIEINHYITRSLKAHSLFKLDVDYVIQDNEILIVDEHTGRLMYGRRYSEGIHQAIETKEKVAVKKESKTLATISFQNLFRKFEKLSGMTGTAMTEEKEFGHTYYLDCVEVPTNRPVIREDKTDKVYFKKSGKLRGIVNTVKECNKIGQPILVGTTSVEASEELSALFKKEGIRHNVLNAKQHEHEARIVAQAGEFGAVTIATNMAGRGTDIMLGGNVEFKTKAELRKLGYSEELIEESNAHTETDNPEVLEVRKLYKSLYAEIDAHTKPLADKVKAVGGLYILGTERHSSRRIDNQLRGRSGRQGDPGVSEFVVSLEDDLMRLFGADKVAAFLENANFPEDRPIDAKMVSNSIEKAQRKIEGMHFGMRKTLMDYDDVMTSQREIVYKQRDEFLASKSVVEDMQKLIHIFIEDNVKQCIMNPKKITLGDQEMLVSAFSEIPGLEKLPNYTEEELKEISIETIVENLQNEVTEKIDFFIRFTNRELLEAHMKRTLLFLIDSAWQDHIVALDDLKEGIGLRALGQQNPLEAYRTEGFQMFGAMLDSVRKEMFIAFMQNHKVLKEGIEKAVRSKIIS